MFNNHSNISKMKYTKEQVAEWKKKHGEIFEITVEDKSCILRRPNRKDLSFVSVVKDPIKKFESLVRQTWLDGDEEMLTDDEYFIPMLPKLGNLTIYADAAIKKL